MQAIWAARPSSGLPDVAGLALERHHRSCRMLDGRQCSGCETGDFVSSCNTIVRLRTQLPHMVR